MPLTDVQARKAKPADKPYKLVDAAGLHLYISPAGGKSWRMRYEFQAREKLLTFGPYPDVSLLDARTARDEAKATLRSGRDPGIERKLKKATTTTQNGETFEIIAREWHHLNAPRWTPRHAQEVLTTLERDVFPVVGSTPIRRLQAPEVLALLRKIEGRQAKETARRVRQRMSAVFVYAISSGRGAIDPAATVQRAMAPLKKSRQPAITDLAQAREILARVEGNPAHPVTVLALRLLALTAVRPGTLIGTPWDEFAALDPSAPVWQIPAARMKLHLHKKDDAARDHLVPLSRQAVETIEALRILTGRGPLVLPNTRSAHKPMSENAIGYLLNRAGYHHKHVPHGWRSTFSTVMNERFPADRAVIDLMLAHTPENKVEGVYNRSLHLARRAELAQIWADLIMDGRPSAMSLLPRTRR